MGIFFPSSEVFLTIENVRGKVILMRRIPILVGLYYTIIDFNEVDIRI